MCIPCSFSRASLRSMQNVLQRWTYAADALEELCPGASSATFASKLSRCRQAPTPNPAAVVAPIGRSDSNGGSRGMTTQDQGQTSHSRFPLTVAAAADTATAAVEAGKKRPGPHDGLVVVSTAESDERRLAVVGAVEATDDQNVQRDNACSSLSSVPANSEFPRSQLTLDSCTTTTTAAASAAVALMDSTTDEDELPAGSTSALSPPPRAALPLPQPLVSRAVPMTTLLPVAEAIVSSSEASSPTVPHLRQQLQQPHVLSLPAAACSQETFVGVARQLQEYAEAVATARPLRAATGSGKDGIGDVAGGALGAGIDGGSGSVSPPMYLQGPPPESLFDSLLEEVVQALEHT